MSFSPFENPQPLPLLMATMPPPQETIKDVNAFRSILSRDSPSEQVESYCRQLIKKYTKSADWVSLYYLYGLIRETREQMLERDLTYSMLYSWYEEHPIWGATALVDCVYNYGCWKDIKYLCEYCKKKSGRMDHPFILYAICLLDKQLKDDWALVEKNPPHISQLSYAAKWTPREKSKYGWIYTMLSAGYFGYLIGAVTLKQNIGALNKSKMKLRKILSTINKHLDTVEIKMCGNYWDYIKPANIPVHATFKYHRAFYRHGVDAQLGFCRILNYPYSNIKKLADSVNNDYLLDEEVDTSQSTPTSYKKTSKDYRQNFEKMVSIFFNQEKGKALSIIDTSTLQKEDMNIAVGWSCVECDGAMILNKNGKYHFVSLQSTTLCDRVQELSKKVSEAQTQTQSTTTPNSTPAANLKSVCLFMEKCFNETDMSETSRDNIKFFVFSRQPSEVLENICNKNIFELKL